MKKHINSLVKAATSSVIALSAILSLQGNAEASTWLECGTGGSCTPWEATPPFALMRYGNGTDGYFYTPFGPSKPMARPRSSPFSSRRIGRPPNVTDNLCRSITGGSAFVVCKAGFDATSSAIRFERPHRADKTGTVQEK